MLGNVEIHGNDGVVVRPQRSGERCVLAALAFNVGRPVGVARLVDHLWLAAEQSDRSMATVGMYLRKVRAALVQAGGRSDWVRYDRAARSCVLDVDPSWVDYHRVTTLVTTARHRQDPDGLRAALRRWQGPALADVHGHWADHRRDTWEAERAAAYEDLLQYLLSQGQPAEAARTATDLVDGLVPTDRLLLLGAHGLAGSGRHTAIPGWVDRVVQRMRQTADSTPSADVLHEINRLITRTDAQPIRSSVTADIAPATWHPPAASAVRPTRPHCLRIPLSSDARRHATRVEPLEQLWRHNASLINLLPSVSTTCDSHLARISQHDRFEIDSQHRLRSLQCRQVLGAERDGVDRWIVIYDWEITTRNAPRFVNLHNCRLGRMAVDHDAHILVAELLFDRPLKVGDTLTMGYQVINPANDHGRDGNYYFRRLPRPVRHYTIEAHFSRAALPTVCQQISKSADTDGRLQHRMVTVRSTGETQVVAVDPQPGLFGIEWGWPSTQHPATAEVIAGSREG